MQQACEDVYVDPALRMYMVEIVFEQEKLSILEYWLVHLLVVRSFTKTSKAAALKVETSSPQMMSRLFLN